MLERRGRGCIETSPRVQKLDPLITPETTARVLVVSDETRHTP